MTDKRESTYIQFPHFIFLTYSHSLPATATLVVVGFDRNVITLKFIAFPACKGFD